MEEDISAYSSIVTFVKLLLCSSPHPSVTPQRGALSCEDFVCSQIVHIEKCAEAIRKRVGRLEELVNLAYEVCVTV